MHTVKLISFSSAFVTKGECRGEKVAGGERRRRHRGQSGLLDPGQGQAGGRHSPVQQQDLQRLRGEGKTLGGIGLVEVEIPGLQVL